MSKASTHQTPAAACVALADGLLRLGHVDGAIQQYQRALAVDPRCALAHAGLAAVALILNDEPAAFSGYERALELTPDDPIIHQGILLNMHYGEMYGPDQIFAAHRRLASISLPLC